MNLFADEGVDRQIVERLRRDGHIVDYVAELSPGITDDVVLTRAGDSGSVLVTADKDFGELVFRQRRANAGVLLLRLSGRSPDQKAMIVSAVIASHSRELPGAFGVLTWAGLRLRRPQR